MQSEDTFESDFNEIMQMQYKWWCDTMRQVHQESLITEKKYWHKENEPTDSTIPSH